MIAIFATRPGEPGECCRTRCTPEPVRRVPAVPAPPRLSDPAGCIDRDWTRRTPWTRSWSRSSPAVYSRARAPVGRLRDLRGTRRCRGHVPDLAVPAPQDRRADHRLQARHRRLVGRGVPARGAGADVLPRAVRRPHRDRPLIIDRPTEPGPCRGPAGYPHRLPRPLVGRRRRSTPPTRLAGFRDRFLPRTATSSPIWTAIRWAARWRPSPRPGTSSLTRQWAGRLIRGWTEGWMELPEHVGDELAAAALGAAPGQTIIADSTTVNFYKAMRAALERWCRGAARSSRTGTTSPPTDTWSSRWPGSWGSRSGLAGTGHGRRGRTAEDCHGRARRRRRGGDAEPRRLPVRLHRRRRRRSPPPPTSRRGGGLGPVPLGGDPARCSWTRGASTSPSAAPTSSSAPGPGAPALPMPTPATTIGPGPADLGLAGPGGLVRDGAGISCRRPASAR